MAGPVKQPFSLQAEPHQVIEEPKSGLVRIQYLCEILGPGVGDVHDGLSSRIPHISEGKLLSNGIRPLISVSDGFELDPPCFEIVAWIVVRAPNFGVGTWSGGGRHR